MVLSKHTLEDPESWKLALERENEGFQRRLKEQKKEKKHHHHHHHHRDDDDMKQDDGDDDTTIFIKKIKKHHHPRDDDDVDDDDDKKHGDEDDDTTTETETETEAPEGVNETLPPIQVKQKSYDKEVLTPPDGDTMQAMMIDAGSQGTRIHVYEFDHRILYTAEELTDALNGYKISIPTTNTRWTNRLKPGIDALASYSDDDRLMQELQTYLSPLFDFARTVLDGKQDDWSRYPIYLKATGGMRTLPTKGRLRLISAVRDLFLNETFNPFKFADVEQARVISGEEEAMYGWAAVNFALGTLVRDSEGKGVVLNPHRTWGMLEMGGASTQIAWFQNDGDVMANLMKLQIGGARHWNIYAHSFLYFGINGAWDRLNAFLVKQGNKTDTTNPCLPSGASVEFDSWIHYDEDLRPLPRSDPRSEPYSAVISNNSTNFEKCTLLTRALLRKKTNKDWVEFSHNGDCSFAGVYQPPLPTKNSKDDEFILTSNYYDVWDFLKLPNRSSIQSVQDGARKICEMDSHSLQEYNSLLENPAKDDDLYQLCFRATLTFEMLHTGYGFPLEYEIQAADVVNGQKLGWALGSTLYEINTLPWEFGGKYEEHQRRHHKNEKKMVILGSSRVSSQSTEADDSLKMTAVVIVASFVLTLLWLSKRHSNRRNTRESYQQLR